MTVLMPPLARLNSLPTTSVARDSLLVTKRDELVHSGLPLF
jgi:hypothetical protein